MAAQPQTKEAAAAEEVHLNLLPGSGEEQNNLNHAISGRAAASCCPDSHHRKLAICSIICGLSCIGYQALIYSVKVLSGVSTCTGRSQALFTCTADVFYVF